MWRLVSSPHFLSFISFILNYTFFSNVFSFWECHTFIQCILSKSTLHSTFPTPFQPQLCYLHPNTLFSFMYFSPSLCSHQLLIAPQLALTSPVSTLGCEMSWSYAGWHNVYESIVTTSLTFPENTICTTPSYPLTLTNSPYHLPWDRQEGI